MVCSKVDSRDQMKNMDGDRDSGNFGKSKAIDILTPEGKTLKMYIPDSTTIECIKIDCELLCGIPSDLQLVKHQDKDLGNDETIASLNISDGCTLRVTVPQWWQKFISTCYKGDVQQVKKRAFVKMNQVSREERNFTAAFIGAVKGNHNLMFATCAGRNMNLHTKTKLSGRNLLHAAVSGGSTSCVANIFMNGGNALLEAPDNTGETPVKMAEKLYGASGDLVKFLNVYLELHRRDAKSSGSSNRFWDNLERNNDSSGGISADDEFDNGENSRSQSNENINGQLEDLSLDSDEQTGEKKTTNGTETKFFSNNTATPLTRVNIEDYDATTGENASHVEFDDLTNSDNEQMGANFENESSSKQCNVPKSDTGYYSGNNQSIRKDAPRVTEMLWNEHLFTQANTPPAGSTTDHELSLAHNRSEEDAEVTSVSLLSTDPTYADSNEPDRRAHLRNEGLKEQRRKTTTTERPNLEILLSISSESSAPVLWISPGNEPHNSEGFVNESRDYRQANEENENEPKDKQCCAIKETGVVNAWNDQATPQMTISSEKSDTDTVYSPKPLRRAQLRKKSIVEQQRRRRSLAGRPNLEELIRKHEEKSEQEDALEIGEEEGSGAMGSNETGPFALVTTTEDSFKLKCKEKLDDADSKDRSLTTIKREKEKGNSDKESKGKNVSAMDYQEDESPVSARYVLQMWQNQAQENVKSAENALSGDEMDSSCSPKMPRRALLRKQVFMEQRRKRSATERPNLIKLMDSRRKEDDEDEKPVHEEIEMVRQEERETDKDNKHNDFVIQADQERALKSDFSSANSGESASMKERNLESKKAPTQPPLTGTSQKRVSTRVTQRRSNDGHLLEARARKDKRSNWSCPSGDESEVSENEQKVVNETVTNIKTSSKTQRRRRLPMVPSRAIKLPLIKIEDSGTSTGSDQGDTHMSRRNHVHYSVPVSGDGKPSVLSDNFKVPHPPGGRSRSSSMCSEDSVSSGEMLGERSRAKSEGETTIGTQPISLVKNLPVNQRRQSVPINTFTPAQNTSITRTRRSSVQVEDLDEQGYQISPQLRARLQMREQPRENLPWNEWRTGRRRSNSFPDVKEAENSGPINTNQGELHKDERSDKRAEIRGETRNETLVAWNEKRRPESARHGTHRRMTFTEWLDNKEALDRSRPTSAQRRNVNAKDNVNHHSQTVKAYKEWLRKKDQEALDKEETLRRRGKKKVYRTYHRK